MVGTANSSTVDDEAAPFYFVRLDMSKRLITLRQIQAEKLPRSRSWIFAELKAGRFPKPLEMGATQSIYFPSFAQVQNYPGYRFDIDPDATELVGMIGSYYLNPMVPCGLSSCHKKHKHGYVVVTADGEVTNIGNDCGKKHFPEGWAVHRNALESRHRIQRYREVIALCVANKQVFEEQLRGLKERTRGGTWQNTLANEFSRVMPFDVMKQIRDRAQKGISEVFFERPMTLQEMENEDIRLGRNPDEERLRRAVRYVRVPCGHLNGLRIWARPIRTVLVEELEQKMRDLLTVDFYQLSEQRLFKLSKWVEDCDRLFKEADTLLLEGQAFFTKANLEMILRIDVPNDTRVTLVRNLRAFCSKHRLV